MKAPRLLLAALSFSFATCSPLTKRSVNFAWGSEPVLGVNLGGWLVLEPWITPSIFRKFPGDVVVDEWTLCAEYPDLAPSILRQHWDSWVSLADFEKIASNGFNMVRIPIGYWAFQKANDPYLQGAASYLDQAINWARQSGLKVVIDLHGAPQSQNGYDNSGHNGTVGWSSPGSSVPTTRAVIQQISNKYAQASYQDVVAGIEVLNEPLLSALPGGASVLEQYYTDSYGDVRAVSDTPVVIHDAFQQGTYWDGTLSGNGDSNVVVDHHEYQVFTDQLVSMTSQQHIDFVCSNSNTYADSVNHWVIVGEWTAAMTDCAPYLNGYQVGNRYEGTYFGSTGPTGRSCGTINDITTWNQSLVSDTTRFINAQLDVYTQQAKGFFFWNFKTEEAAEWDLFRLIDNKIFPDLNGRGPTSLCSS